MNLTSHESGENFTSSLWIIKNWTDEGKAVEELKTI